MSTGRAPPNPPMKKALSGSSISPNAIPFSPNTIPPSVCSIHPGKVLALSTSIGLSQYKAMRSGAPDEYQWNHSLIEGKNKGRLRSGRLYPLNLHTQPVLNSQTCLGVISVNSSRTSLSRQRHTRSLTAPVTRPTHLTQYNLYGNKIMYNRRVYSALGPPPGRIEGSFNQWLPPVTSDESPLDIKVEVTEKNKSSENVLQQSDKINDIKQSIADGEDNPVTSDKSREQQPSTPLEINLVKEERHKIDVIVKKHRKISGLSEAKLSYGWTSSQPITSPLVGSLPPLTNTKELRERKKSCDNVTVDKTDSDLINIDVDKVLQQNITNKT